MVTAIVIPIICLYFYWLTKKEMKEHDRKWLSAGEVKHEGIITGEIKSILQERQRFYYHRYIFVQELHIQTETKLIKARKITPLSKSVLIDEFIAGDVVRIYGSWEGSRFQFNKSEVISINKSKEQR